MNVELTALVLTPEEKQNLAFVGQSVPQALQEGTLSAAFSHLASLDQVLAAFNTPSSPFTAAPAAQ
jgi:hypothetical protein